jgi:hypothetical protein
MADVTPSMVAHWLRGRAKSSKLDALRDRLLGGPGAA